jgi:hypothetical protein
MARWRTGSRRAWRLAVVACLIQTVCPLSAAAQVRRRLFPERALLPMVFAGPRDPVSKADLAFVTDNPNRLGSGVEAEVALGAGIPVYLLAGDSESNALVAGVEAAVFGRFGFQVTERPLINTDWVFAAPIVWHLGPHWVRLRYFHTSSHLGDEYAQRFEAEAVNFSRDAVDAMGWLQPLRALGAYLGVRYAYSVHPEESRRWAARAGTQLGSAEGEGFVLPFGAIDVELDQNVDWKPRVNVQAGVWLPPISGRRAGRIGAGVLTGPSPLGQFQALHTTQITLGISLNL